MKISETTLIADPFFYQVCVNSSLCSSDMHRLHIFNMTDEGCVFALVLPKTPGHPMDGATLYSWSPSTDTPATINTITLDMVAIKWMLPLMQQALND